MYNVDKPVICFPLDLSVATGRLTVLTTHWPGDEAIGARLCVITAYRLLHVHVQ